MKRFVSYMCLIFLPLVSSGQFDYSVDIMFSTDYTSIGNFGSSDLFTSRISGVKNYRSGIHFNASISKNIILKTGLRYAGIGFIDRVATLNESNINIVTSEFINPELPEYFFTAADFKFLEIPLVPRYETHLKAFSFFVEFGLSYHLYLDSNISRYSDKGVEEVYYDGMDLVGQRHNLVYVTGLGLGLRLFDSYQIFAQTSLRFLQSIRNDYMVIDGLRSVGLEFGVRKMFDFKMDIPK